MVEPISPQKEKKHLQSSLKMILVALSKTMSIKICGWLLMILLLTHKSTAMYVVITDMVKLLTK